MVNPEVFLQTLNVKLKSEHQAVCVRALIDTGSQKFCILKDTAERMVYIAIREKAAVHSFFWKWNYGTSQISLLQDQVR
jgi:hypothetical protein